jgi:hypothetical protein
MGRVWLWIRMGDGKGREGGRDSGAGSGGGRLVGECKMAWHGTEFGV